MFPVCRVRSQLLPALSVLVWAASAPMPACATAPETAPLDPTAIDLPGAQAFWLKDSEFGGRIYTLESGTGRAPTGLPPLVLIHGLGDAGMRDFYPVLEELGKNRRVIAFDLPGFGRSSKSNENYSPERYAAVAKKIIDDRAGGYADVMGHSMGGAIAVMHAGLHPKQVRRLVLVDAAGILHREAFVGEQIHGRMNLARGYLPGVTAAIEEFAGNLLRKARAADLPPEFLVGNRLLRQHALGGEPGRIAAVSLIATNFAPAIANVRAPTLILWGQEDAIAPLRTARLLSSRLPQTQLHIFDGVGHVPMKETPQSMAAAVRAHLDTTLSIAKPIATPASQGDYNCAHKSDAEVTGRFDTITLDGCERIALVNVAAQRLVMRHSTAAAVDSHILGGIDIVDSLLTMTGGDVAGSPVITVSQSRLDFAGVRLTGQTDLLDVKQTSRLLCSVCPITDGGAERYLHGERILRTGSTGL